MPPILFFVCCRQNLGQPSSSILLLRSKLVEIAIKNNSCVNSSALGRLTDCFYQALVQPTIIVFMYPGWLFSTIYLNFLPPQGYFGHRI
jgi:hypothetical protein